MPKLQDTDLVDGDGGYISSDSDFYGDIQLRKHLNHRARTYHPLPTHLPSKTLPTSLPSPTALALKNISTIAPPAQKPHNPHEGDRSAKQLSELLDEFLRRLPPSRTPSSIYGPWIWIANPLAARRASPDIAHLMERGEGMLAEFAERRRGIEDDMAAKAKATVTRKVNPLRAALAEGLLALAKELNETSGKWMLFPSPADVDRIWATVCQGVLDGKLGPAAKVATADDVGLEGGGERGRLVCVYTADFSDIKDVKRVLLSLKEMGLVDRKGAYGQDVGIWYKCDAYTHLGIDSSNPWGLKASLYASKDVLARDV